MLSQSHSDQFIFKIRVLLNKTVEFSITCLSCRPIAALSSGSRHYSGKSQFFLQMAKEEKNALKHWVRPLHAGCRLWLPSLKKVKQHQARLVFGWVTALNVSSGSDGSRECAYIGEKSVWLVRSRSLDACISRTGWPMHERSSLFDVTIQSILYLTGTDTRRCLPRHVARAESEGVGDTIPSVTPRRVARLCSNLVCVWTPATCFFYIM